MSVGSPDRTFGIQPSEFWAMSIAEWWWKFDSEIDHNNRVKNPDHISEREWADAHRRHREKKNDRT